MSKKRFLHAELTYAIIGAAMTVHKALGHGFLESVYENGLVRELVIQGGYEVQQQVSFDIAYKGARIGYYIADLIVNDAVVVEIKAVQRLVNAHKAQCLNYLAASGIRVALLLNFGTESLEYKRLVR